MVRRDGEIVPHPAKVQGLLAQMHLQQYEDLTLRRLEPAAFGILAGWCSYYRLSPRVSRFWEFIQGQYTCSDCWVSGLPATGLHLPTGIRDLPWGAGLRCPVPTLGP